MKTLEQSMAEFFAPRPNATPDFKHVMARAVAKNISTEDAFYLYAHGYLQAQIDESNERTKEFLARREERSHSHTIKRQAG
jgi:hypothetical protein